MQLFKKNNSNKNKKKYFINLTKINLQKRHFSAKIKEIINKFNYETI
jgi:hypothetical protein